MATKKLVKEFTTKQQPATHGGAQKIVAAVIVVAIFAAIGYFFLSAGSTTEVPDYVTGQTREVYEFAKTPQGWEALEKIPCYCGCKYEGHDHSRHCFWRDDGTFDKHGVTCSVCLDIGIKTKAMMEEGHDICEIRKEIDEFYAPNAQLATDTPYPEGCEVP